MAVPKYRGRVPQDLNAGTLSMGSRCWIQYWKTMANPPAVNMLAKDANQDKTFKLVTKVYGTKAANTRSSKILRSGHQWEATMTTCKEQNV